VNVTIYRDSKAQNLDRIVAYPDSPDGLAYIRDTGILASEVAARMADRQFSPGDILRDYPILEPEDVQQAMVYVMREMREMFGYRVVELRAPIVSVQVSAELYLRYYERMQDDRKLKVIQQVSASSLEMLDVLGDFTFVFRAFYDDHRKELRQLALLELSSHLTSDTYPFRRNVIPSKLEINISESIPPVKCHDSVVDALYTLLVRVFPRNSRDQKASLEVSQSQPTVVDFMVTRYMSSPFARNEDDVWLRNPILSAVVRLLKLSNSELKISPAADHVKFTFQLPVWSENEPV
jgi:uncharacterized protein (DUF433 family)